MRGERISPLFVMLKDKGFTFIELIFTIVILLTIIMIAFPLYCMRTARPEFSKVKAQLKKIKKAEEQYREIYGTYTDDPARLYDWKPFLGRYRFVIKTASTDSFIAEADGDLEDDGFYEEAWTIDHRGKIVKTHPD